MRRLNSRIEMNGSMKMHKYMNMYGMLYTYVNIFTHLYTDYNYI